MRMCFHDLTCCSQHVSFMVNTNQNFDFWTYVWSVIPIQPPSTMKYNSVNSCNSGDESILFLYHGNSILITIMFVFITTNLWQAQYISAGKRKHLFSWYFPLKLTTSAVGFIVCQVPIVQTFLSNQIALIPTESAHTYFTANFSKLLETTVKEAVY